MFNLDYLKAPEEKLFHLDLIVDLWIEGLTFDGDLKRVELSDKEKGIAKSKIQGRTGVNRRGKQTENRNIKEDDESVDFFAKNGMLDYVKQKVFFNIFYLILINYFIIHAQ